MEKAVKDRINEWMSIIRQSLTEPENEFESLESFLTFLNISKNEYDNVLKFGFSEPTVVYQRQPNERWINCYNPRTLELLESNQDVAFALSMYGCICYLLSYLCKPERNVSKVMKDIMLKENEDCVRLLSSMKKVWIGEVFGCHSP